MDNVEVAKVVHDDFFDIEMPYFTPIHKFFRSLELEPLIVDRDVRLASFEQQNAPTRLADSLHLVCKLLSVEDRVEREGIYYSIKGVIIEV